MNHRSDTGESNATIIGRINDRAWDRVRPLLEAGGLLRRVARINLYYVENVGGLTPSRLERDGVIQRVGVDTYRLLNPIACGSTAGDAP